MKKLSHILTICILVGLFLTACQNQESPTNEEVNEETSKQVVQSSPNLDAEVATVQSYIDALLEVDESILREITTDEFYSYLVKSPMDSSGIDELIASWNEIAETRSNQRVDRTAVSSRIVKEGEYAGVWVHYWGTYVGTVNENGVELVVPFYSNTLLVDGKIHRTYSFYDRLAIMEAQGYELVKKK